MIHEIHEAAHARHQAIGIRHDPRCPRCREIAVDRLLNRVDRPRAVNADRPEWAKRQRATRRARRVAR